MAVYEFLVVHLDQKRITAENQLNELGAQGWAMVAHSPGTPNYTERAYLQRRADEQPGPQPGNVPSAHSVLGTKRDA
jgi:hypothetical protein